MWVSLDAQVQHDMRSTTPAHHLSISGITAPGMQVTGFATPTDLSTWVQKDICFWVLHPIKGHKELEKG